MVVAIQGTEHRLTGTADVQYQEWRDLLKQMVVSEGAFVPEDVAIYSEPEPALPTEDPLPTVVSPAPADDAPAPSEDAAPRVAMPKRRPKRQSKPSPMLPRALQAEPDSAPLRRAATPSPIGRDSASGDAWQLVELLGSGGDSQVWRATDAAGRSIAVKIPRAPSTRAAARLAHEHAMLAALAHRHVVVHAWVSSSNAERRRSRSSTCPAAISCRSSARIRAIGSRPHVRVHAALAHLHERGFVHRDVKARNVLFGADGCARLIDFASALPRGERAGAWRHDGRPPRTGAAGPRPRRVRRRLRVRGAALRAARRPPAARGRAGARRARTRRGVAARPRRRSRGGRARGARARGARHGATRDFPRSQMS